MDSPPPTVLHITTTDVSLKLLLGPQLRAFREAGFNVELASAPGAHSADLEAEGFTHHPLRHATRSTAPHRDVLALQELYRLIRRTKPDLVHTHNPKPGVYGRIAARVARCRSIVNTQHGLYAQPHDRLARRAAVYGLERIAATFSDLELIQSSEDLETLARLRVPQRKLRLLGNGIDLNRFGYRADERARIRSELCLDDDTVVVGSAGRLVAEKGFLELFQAARSLRYTHPKVAFVVAGPSDPAKGDPLDSVAIRAAESNGVRFLGMRDDIAELYSAFDIFVLASHREGFPRTVMEAAATGLPVIATDIRGCRQAVKDSETGYLVPAHDSAALRDAISALAANQGKRVEMGRAALTLAREEFDQERVIRRTLEAYRELLSRG